jgi:hypothetical protein
MGELESLVGHLDHYMHAKRESEAVQKTTFYATEKVPKC